MSRPGTIRRGEAIALLAAGALCLALSRVGAVEPGTWLLEVFPIFIAVPLLLATARRFPLTPLAYRLIFVHALILMLGGHYTYAKVPLGFWVQDAFHLARNHYDRIGHFAQGFVPAIIAREILLRRSRLTPGKWLFFVVTCVCLAVSACYEFIEWAAAVIGGSGADAFLGTQGDVWDTQWDMFMALLGAIVAQLLLGGAHDRAIARLETTGPARPAATAERLVYVVAWEFTVRAGAENTFERLYGPAGRWVTLFGRAAGYIGTELLRAADGSRRYMTIDRWRSEAAYHAFRAEWRAAYDALDEEGEGLTESERELGAFTAA